MQTSEILQQQAEPATRGRATWTPHPAVLILLWILLAIATPSLPAALLGLVGIVLTAAAMKLSAERLYVLLRRVRWIMLSLLVVYGYVTPGQTLWEQAGVFSPTQQGLLDGMLQLCRLVFMLAGLSIVLAILSRQQLIGGLYTLAYPLRCLGVSRERFAVRLALTLHYAESSLADTGTTDWRGNLERMLEPAADSQGVIELQNRPITLRDGLLFVAGCALLASVLW
jgi:energy-coupling factor transporter transmembrane protein EcfT